MNDVEMKPGGWKAKVTHEMVEYLTNFVYLACFFAAFAWYRRLILAARGDPILDYGVPIIEAAVLAKVIMILGMLRLGRRLEDKPLIVPTLYKTLVFSLWIAVFGILEHMIRGLIHGRGLTGGIVELATNGRDELLARCLMKFLALIPFFAFREVGRVLGEGKLRSLFWRSGASLAPGSADLTSAQTLMRR